jgi:hypothetical protein
MCIRALQLSDLAGDSWTGEDLAEATASAVRRFEDQQQADR